MYIGRPTRIRLTFDNLLNNSPTSHTQLSHTEETGRSTFSHQPLQHHDTVCDRGLPLFTVQEQSRLFDLDLPHHERRFVRIDEELGPIFEEGAVFATVRVLFQRQQIIPDREIRDQKGALRERIFTRERLVITLVADEDTENAMRCRISDFVTQLPTGRKPVSHTFDLPESSRAIGWTFPSGTQYAAASYDIAALRQVYRPALELIAVLGERISIEQVRNNGRAYGANVSIGYGTNLLRAVSTQDPQPVETLYAISRLGASLRNVTDEDVERAKLRYLARSAYVGSAFEDGRNELFHRRAGNLPERFRGECEGVLGVSSSEVREAAAALEALGAPDTTIVLGSRAALDQVEKRGIRLVRESFIP